MRYFYAVVGIINGLLSAAPLRAQDPATVGQWSPVIRWPYEPIHAHLLPTGKVLCWTRGDHSQLWYPATNVVTPAAASGANIFCSGHAFLPDGRLIVTGGHIQSWVGLQSSYSYDPFKNAWTRLPDMNNGRWYPTTVTLPSGDVLTLSGWIDTSQGDNSVPQVWQTATNSWRELTAAQLSLPFYPFMFVAPNGKVFSAGPNQASRYLNVSGTGAWSFVANNLYGTRNWGSAVMYDDGKILITGGTQCNPYATNCAKLPTATAETIDLNNSHPSWKYTGSMARPRKLHNATLLPDGTVLVTGGSSGSEDPNTNSKNPVYSSESWNPSDGSWSPRANLTVFRGYHSVALLLPDARVLSAGGDFGGASAEIYSPPYLFKGVRPSISSAPPSINYNQTFFVETPDALSISQVTLLALSSVTHGFNMGQRIARLAFSLASGGLNVSAPATPNSDPPGYYMLFLVNSAGVPSIASFVQLSGSDSGSGTGPTQKPSVPGTLSASAISSSQINLTWIDTSSNESGFKIRRSADGVNFTHLATVGANTTQYADTNLAQATKYYYRVRAYNSFGASADSNTASATTPSTATPTPTATVTPTPTPAPTAPTATPTATASPTPTRSMPQLSGMTVVAAPSGGFVAQFVDGYSYNRQSSLSVRADPASGVGCVVFQLDGAQLNIENVLPYSVAGDTNGNYNAWKPAAGNHTLVAKPYGASGGKGTAGPAVSVKFTVVSGASTPALTRIAAAPNPTP